MMDTYAHTADGKPESQWHSLDDHLESVAGMAARFAEAFQAREWGVCAGGLHDIGKALPLFQKYLRQCAQGLGRRGDAPHSIYGAALTVQRYEGKYKVYGKLLAYILSGHHGGLPDWKDLEHRLEDAPGLDEAAAAAEGVVWPAVFPFKGFSSREAGFVLSFFVRMLFSCLVDADWLDTEAFKDEDKAAWRTGGPALPDLAARFFPRLEQLSRTAKPTPVNAIRREVLDACLAAADQPPGLFSLTVPTGGGKTLSSLAFALRHAERHGLERVIYVAVSSSKCNTQSLGIGVF